MNILRVIRKEIAETFQQVRGEANDTKKSLSKRTSIVYKKLRGSLCTLFPSSILSNELSFLGKSRGQDNTRNRGEHLESKPHKSLHNITPNDFSSYLPYESFDYKTGVFENKNSLAILLSSNPLAGGLSQSSKLERFLKTELPSGAVITVMNFASPEIEEYLKSWGQVSDDCDSSKSQVITQRGCKKSYQPRTIDGIYSNLSLKRRDFFQKRRGSVFKSYKLLISISMQKALTPHENEKIAQNLVELRGKIISSLLLENCYAKSLDMRGLDSILDQIIPTNSKLSIKKSSTKMSGDNSSRRAVVFALERFPEEWGFENSVNVMGCASGNSNLPFPFYFTFSYSPLGMRKSQEIASKKKLLRINQISGKLLSFFGKMGTELQDWEQVGEEIKNGARLSVGSMLFVALPDATLNIEQVTQKVTDHFAQVGFHLYRADYNNFGLFTLSLPMAMADSFKTLKRRGLGSFSLPSSACVRLLPLFADPQSSVDPQMLLVGRRDQVFFWNNFELMGENGNFNMVVVGKSGSGKSVFLQEHAVSILKAGGCVVVLDNGKSFKNWCRILKGEYFDFSATTQKDKPEDKLKDTSKQRVAINPFSLFKPPIDVSASELAEWKIDFEESLIDLIVSILCIICNLDKNENKDFESGLIQKILRYTTLIVLEEFGDKGGFKEIYEVLQDDRLQAGKIQSGLSHSLVNFAKIKEIAKICAFKLEEYAIGRHKGAFNGESSLTVEGSLNVIELSGLKSNEVLETAVLLVSSYLVFSKMAKRERKTALVIDEGWYLLRHSAIKSVLEHIARTARKYNGCLIVGTQNLSDFEETKSKAGAAILLQSQWRIFLSAEGKDVPLLKKLWHSENQSMQSPLISQALSLRGEKGKYSEALITFEDRGIIGRLYLDPFSVQLYSSTAEDVKKIEKLEQEGMSLENALEIVSHDGSSYEQEAGL